MMGQTRGASSRFSFPLEGERTRLVGVRSTRIVERIGAPDEKGRGGWLEDFEKSDGGKNILQGDLTDKIR